MAAAAERECRQWVTLSGSIHYTSITLLYLPKGNVGREGYVEHPLGERKHPHMTFPLFNFAHV